MRKLYNEYFHISENGILREKVFFARIAVSVACIVLCMAALGFNAYAFFTSEVTSSMNVIKSANYDLDIVVTKDDGSGTIIQPTVPVVAEGENISVIPGATTYTLGQGKYILSFTKVEGGATTGYAKILVGKDVKPFFTKQIGGVVDDNKKEITSRTVSISLEADATVWITPCWGTYAGNATDTDLISDGNELVYGSGGKLQEKAITLNVAAESGTSDAESTNGAAPAENNVQNAENQSMIKQNVVESQETTTNVTDQNSEETKTDEEETAETTSVSE